MSDYQFNDRLESQKSNSTEATSHALFGSISNEDWKAFSKKSASSESDMAGDTWRTCPDGSKVKSTIKNCPTGNV